MATGMGPSEMFARQHWKDWMVSVGQRNNTLVVKIGARAPQEEVDRLPKRYCGMEIVIERQSADVGKVKPL